MKRELGLNFPLVSDADEVVLKRYGLLHPGGGPNENGDVARPGDLLLDRKGIIRWALFGENIRVRAHPDRILEISKTID